MKKNFEMKGTCGACGADMTLRGFREARALPPLSLKTLRIELRATRQLRGLTLRDVEAQTGLSNALISQIETGKVKDTTISTYMKLRKWIGGEP